LRRRSALLLAACLLLVPALAPAQVTMRNMSLESHWDEYTFTISSYRYSSCWSYVHGDGREYAVLGTAQGTAIYNVTDPANSYRVGFIQGPNSIWREMKSYREWIYVVSEGPGPLEGLQIISMADPENPVLVNTYTATFSLCHTVTVDTTRALLFANGTRFNAGGGSYPNVGTRILSLANPASPVEVGQYGEVGYPGTYAHDSFALGDRLYVSSIYAGRVRVIDVSDPAAPAEITSWTYPGAFTHNAWTDASGDVLYVTDEVNGEPLKIFDISDIMNPVLANQITANPKAIVHNAHVEGDELYLAHYTEGVRILDVSDPLHPAEFAWIDTYPGPSGGFFGVWEVCPYFPSGTVIASDMQTGLYVFRPVRDYGIVRVQVVDQDTQQPLEGVNVYSSTLNDSLVTPASGVAQFAPNPGSDTVLAERFGWTRAAATVDVTSGSRDTVTLILRRKVQVNYSGTLRDAATLAPLDDGEIELSYTPISATTDGAGDFTATSPRGPIARSAPGSRVRSRSTCRPRRSTTTSRRRAAGRSARPGTTRPAGSGCGSNPSAPATRPAA
jgi:choice-of-anchor B domain-containing protein